MNHVVGGGVETQYNMFNIQQMIQQHAIDVIYK